MESRNCLNCEHLLSKSDKYCPNCGQKYERRTGTIKEFFVDFLGDYFTFDSKIFRSVKPLLVQPGFLTIEYLKGKRVSYIPPLRLYIFISVIFFLIFKLTNKVSGIVTEEYENLTQTGEIDYFMDNHLHKLFFLLLPVFAFIVYIFYYRTYRNYLPHFIFSLHYHSFILLTLSIYLLISSYLTASLVELNQWLIIFLVICYLLYLFLALKRVFEEPFGKLLIKLIGIWVVYFTVFISASLLAITVFTRL